MENVFDRKEYMKEYRKTEKFKKTTNTYQQSLRGKTAIMQAISRYQQSEKGVLATKKYRQSKKCKDAVKRYQQSEKGRRAARVSQARQRGLGYNELCENPYPKDIKVAYHHINDMDVVPIPLNVHKHYSLNLTARQHQFFIAKWIKENYPIKINGV